MREKKVKSESKSGGKTRILDVALQVQPEGSKLCGAFCLEMVLDYLGHKKSAEEIADMGGIRTDGVLSSFGIVNGALKVSEDIYILYFSNYLTSMVDMTGKRVLVSGKDKYQLDEMRSSNRVVAFEYLTIQRDRSNIHFKNSTESSYVHRPQPEELLNIIVNQEGLPAIVAVNYKILAGGKLNHNLVVTSVSDSLVSVNNPGPGRWAGKNQKHDFHKFSDAWVASDSDLIALFPNRKQWIKVCLQLKAFAPNVFNARYPELHTELTNYNQT